MSPCTLSHAPSLIVSCCDILSLTSTLPPTLIILSSIIAILFSSLSINPSTRSTSANATAPSLETSEAALDK